MKVLGTDAYFGWPSASPGQIPVWIVLSLLHQAPLAMLVACGSPLSGQELKGLHSLLSHPGPSLCYVPRYLLGREEVSRKMNRNPWND